MALQGRTKLLAAAKVWAYPLWWSVMHSAGAEAAREDVDWWAQCINNAELLSLDQYSRFAYFAGALPEFRSVMHYRLRSSPLPLRLLMRAIYREPSHMVIAAESIGPGLFIQHGHGTLVGAKTIGSHCWINQQVTIGYNEKGGNPTLGDNVRIAVGAIVLGGITLHDGATVGPGAVVTRDVGPGEIMVGPLARPFKRRPLAGDEPA
ncbi:serine acetyltransferase [Mycobacterium sp. OTB74]|uniref:serine acetyltransferase n=1 Tax=Mycobacterium sp. OTB74 TaxID=1853452 RepID=UPI0024734597|nr:serine acetyltransferase [Mycobacterium sp. OTB74]MDH6242396.1 serine O-acetyltransferase [Mycobacterium sp. OTB74]